MVRKILVVMVIVMVLTMVLATTALAANPPGTGQPGQDCNTIQVFPGHSASSPGSPFNEGVGTGGLHYNESSQYDVACFQQSVK